MITVPNPSNFPPQVVTRHGDQWSKEVLKKQPAKHPSPRPARTKSNVPGDHRVVPTEPAKFKHFSNPLNSFRFRLSPEAQAKALDRLLERLRLEDERRRALESGRPSACTCCIF